MRVGAGADIEHPGRLVDGGGVPDPPPDTTGGHNIIMIEDGSSRGIQLEKLSLNQRTIPVRRYPDIHAPVVDDWPRPQHVVRRSSQWRVPDRCPGGGIECIEG